MTTDPRPTRRLWNRLLGWLGVAALVLAAGVAVAALARDRDATAWARVERRDLERTVELTGVLEAIDSSDLNAPQLPNVWRFTIAFMAEEGSKVKAGDPVLGFDDSEIRQTLIQAIADRDTAQKTREKRTTDLAVERERAQLALAEAEAKLRKARLKTEVPDETVSSIELRTARLDLDIAEREAAHRAEKVASGERAARSELEALERQLEYSESRVADLERAVARLQVPAPRDGTVVYKSNWNGEKQRVGNTVWWAETILQIPDLERLRATAEVEEVAAGSIALGQPVKFRLDAYPDRPFNATVTNIHRAIQSRSFRDPTKIMRVDLDLEHTDPVIMRPGMRFAGELVVERAENVLAIPIEAVVAGAGKPAVFVERSMGERLVEPELGLRGDGMVEVVAGLEQGERVRLRPGLGGSSP